MKVSESNLIWTLFLFLASLQALIMRNTVSAIPADTHENCADWAETGECEENPDFMLTHCATSCDKIAKTDSQDLQGIDSFYDLSAPDIDGNVIDFASFKGKVVVLTNVASYCGYTESHYKSLVDLWSRVGASGDVEILAFPCNQFGQQEPDSGAMIKKFAASKGVKFRMMQKINVNGVEADKVYKFLKQEAGPKHIHWNFATYFVVGPDGSVQSFSGVEPMELKETIDELLGKEEL